MNFERFSTVQFPAAKGSPPGPSNGSLQVFLRVDDGMENPFHAGQSKRLPGKMDDLTERKTSQGGETWEYE
jgi:hypothetical protein